MAVIKTGGKQYVVSKGDTIQIEKLPGDLKQGDTVVFGEVLLVDRALLHQNRAEPALLAHRLLRGLSHEVGTHDAAFDQDVAQPLLGEKRPHLIVPARLKIGKYMVMTTAATRRPMVNNRAGSTQVVIRVNARSSSSS